MLDENVHGGFLEKGFALEFLEVFNGLNGKSFALCMVVFMLMF